MAVTRLQDSERTCAVIGAGLIGTGWAVVFARAGFSVKLYDVDPQRAAGSKAQAIKILRELALLGLADEPDLAARCIQVSASISDAISGAHWIQESVAEEATAKRAVYAAMSILPPGAIIGSSASTIPPDELFESFADRERCIVAHPFNPPYVMPLVELVRSTWTASTTLDRARSLLTAVGMSPVVLRRPIFGFAINRLQAAIVNEAMYLVGEGVLDPADVDRCVTDGLGLRWGFIGPFATMDLNAPGGIAEYMAKFGGSYAQLGQNLAHGKPWTEAAMRLVEKSRRERLPVRDLPAGRLKRDAMIAALLRLRKIEFPNGVESMANEVGRTGIVES